MAENFPYLGEETNIQVQEAESQRHYKKKKNYKPISVSKIDAKIFNKTQANWIQHTLKGSYNMI